MPDIKVLAEGKPFDVLPLLSLEQFEHSNNCTRQIDNDCQSDLTNSTGKTAINEQSKLLYLPLTGTRVYRKAYEEENALLVEPRQGLPVDYYSIFFEGGTAITATPSSLYTLLLDSYYFFDG